MTRLIIAVSYHEFDKPQAERLLRLIADCEPVKRDDVELHICRRFDATPAIDSMVYCADKFKVSASTSKTPWTGWPAGCNGQALDLLTETNRRVKSGEWSDVDGLLMLEPDCVPCVPTWIDEIRIAWLRARMDDRWLMGSWRNSGGEFGHINGNCVVVPDLADRIDLGCISPHMAWDCQIVPQVKNRWQVSGLIKNAFATQAATEYDLKTSESGAVRPAIYHGCKSAEAIEIAEGWLK